MYLWVNQHGVLAKSLFEMLRPLDMRHVHSEIIGWSKDGVSEFTQSNPVTQLFWQHLWVFFRAPVWNDTQTLDVSQDHQDPKNLDTHRWSSSTPFSMAAQRSTCAAWPRARPKWISRQWRCGQLGEVGGLWRNRRNPIKMGMSWDIMGYQQTTRPQVRIGYDMYIHTTYTVIVMYICHIDIADVCLQERVKKLIRLYAGVAMPTSPPVIQVGNGTFMETL